MDLNQKGSEAAVMSITSPASEVAMQKKSCADCQTTKTPLWRSGPAGPRSLCNACGIRNRKRRRALLGLEKVGSNKKTNKQSISRSSNSNSSSSSSNEMGVSMNVEVAELEIDMALQRSWGNKKKKAKGIKQKLMEDEEAAMLLMALSCGSVFA